MVANELQLRANVANNISIHAAPPSPVSSLYSEDFHSCVSRAHSVEMPSVSYQPCDVSESPSLSRRDSAMDMPDVVRYQDPFADVSVSHNFENPSQLPLQQSVSVSHAESSFPSVPHLQSPSLAAPKRRVKAPPKPSSQMRVQSPVRMKGPSVLPQTTKSVRRPLAKPAKIRIPSAVPKRRRCEICGSPIAYDGLCEDVFCTSQPKNFFNPRRDSSVLWSGDSLGLTTHSEQKQIGRWSMALWAAMRLNACWQHYSHCCPREVIPTTAGRTLMSSASPRIEEVLRMDSHPP